MGFPTMAPKAAKKEDGEVIKSALAAQLKDGEMVFGVAHLFASFNDTFVHITDLSGRETMVKVTGGMKVKADRDEASPYAAMLAAQDVVAKCKDLGIGGLHIKMRATGGNRTKTPGPGAQSALRPPRSPLVSAASDLSFRIRHQLFVRPCVQLLC